MTWRLPCEVNCNSIDISNRGFARWRQLFLLRTWSTVIWDGHFSGLQSVFIIPYLPYLLTCSEDPVFWERPGERGERREILQGRRWATERVLPRLLPLMSHHFSCIYFDLFHRHRAYYPLLLQFPPPPHLLPLYTEPEICFKQMCVNVSLSTLLLSYKNSILALSHILPTMQQPFSLQNEKN